MTTAEKKKTTRNPCFTTLKSMGRTHRDEPFHLVYGEVLYPKEAKVDPTLLNDWCSLRYLESKKKTGSRWRIETYRHSDGSRYVNRVMFEKLSDNEQVELVLRFGTEFGDKKIVRDGRLRRPRLSADEKKIRDEMIDQFYLDVAKRRMAAAAAAADED